MPCHYAGAMPNAKSRLIRKPEEEQKPWNEC
jgi:hypothetical protein